MSILDQACADAAACAALGFFLGAIAYIKVRRELHPPPPSLEEKARVATDRSRKLLLSHLDDQQLRQFVETHSFSLRGSDQKLYHLYAQSAFGVICVTDSMALCAFPPRVPIFDAMLAQKLMLETNARAFRGVAYEKNLRRYAFVA